MYSQILEILPTMAQQDSTNLQQTTLQTNSFPCPCPTTAHTYSFVRRRSARLQRNKKLTLVPVSPPQEQPSLNFEFAAANHSNTILDQVTLLNIHNTNTQPPPPPQELDFVLSDFFTASSKQQQQGFTCSYTQSQQRELAALQELLFGEEIPVQHPPISSQPLNSLHMFEGPITPPPFAGADEPAFKSTEPDFDPFSFINDFDSVPVHAPRLRPVDSFKADIPILSNAFQAFQQQDNTEKISPLLSPFGLDDDTPPANTPALEADDDSALTSPVWGDLASFDLFPRQFTAIFPPTNTVSPSDLALPLSLPSFDDAVLTTRRKRVDPVVDDEAEEVDQQPKPAKRTKTSSASTAAAKFNGTRKTAVPLIPVEAPTQSRTYIGPASKTTKRAIPAAAAKKVAALKAQAEEEGVDVSDGIAQTVEEKRRQNTLAARKSRHRKAEHLAGLENQLKEQEERIKTLELEKEVWMARAFAAGWLDRTPN